MLRTSKQKNKILRKLIKLGFTEEDVIDSADAILDKLTVNQLMGRDSNGKLVKESPKGKREEGIKKGSKSLKKKKDKTKESLSKK